MKRGIVYAGQGAFDSEESLARWLEAQEELEAKRCLPPDLVELETMAAVDTALDIDDAIHKAEGGAS